MSDTISDECCFGKLRKVLWPIHREELKKFLPMLLIVFFISFSYNMLRTVKDTLIVTADHSGAEAIPFIKLGVMFPGSILMTLLFVKLSNRFSRETVFYLIVCFFLAYFFLFAIVLYPKREALHLHSFANTLQGILPTGCKGLIATIRNWTLTLFYAGCELWGNMVLFVLFWGFANQTTRIGEASRFYPLFGFGGNVSGIIAGQVSVWLSKKECNPDFFLGKTAWEQTLISTLTFVVLSAVVSLFLLRWINTSVLNDPKYYDPTDVKGQSQGKTKFSFQENLAHLFNSKYLLNIAWIVIAYNVVINIVEVVWKDQMKQLYPNPSDYNIYFNQVSTIIGIVATITALFFSGHFYRKYGWTTTAMLTPLILLTTSTIFFTLYLFKDSFAESAILTYWGMTPLATVVFVGTVQNILCRAAKYTVFDASKEMAFVPLSFESNLKGKAAIDGICNRFGKSAGSMAHLSLLILFSSFAASAPYLAMILLFFIYRWVKAVTTVGKEFNHLTNVSMEQEGAIPKTLHAGGILVDREALINGRQAV